MIRQSIISILMLILALGLACHESTRTVPGAHGTILCFGAGNYVFDVLGGEHYRFDFPNEHYSPVIFCVDDTDSLILGSNVQRLIDPNVSPAPCGNPVYRYSPPDTCATLIWPLSDSSALIKSIDYLSESGRYLYCGNWADEWVLFVFDSAYTRISDLTKCALGEHGSYMEYAYWIDSVTIVARVVPEGLVSLNTQTGSRRSLGSGRIVAISSDRSMIVFREEEVGEIDQRFEVHNLKAGTVDTVDIGEKHVSTSAALSSDCRFLAYGKVDGFLEMNMRLHIYDLIDRTDYETGLVTVRHGGWSLLWIDGTFPPPDSL